MKKILSLTISRRGRCYGISAPLLVCLLLTGCSTVRKIQHLPQLLTLKRYSEAQEEISADVERQNSRFDELWAQIGSEEFDCCCADEVRQRFGDPVFRRDAVYQGQPVEEWLYRGAKDFSGNKIYLYFDAEKKLAGFETAAAGK